MKTVAKAIGFTIGSGIIAVGVVTTCAAGAFVAGWMFEAGRDSYKADRREYVKDTVAARAGSIKDKAVGFLKDNNVFPFRSN